MNYNKYIDHTLLLPEATHQQIEKLCQEALQYDFMSVCVNTSWVKECVEFLKGSDVKVCCVVGFPLGATTTSTKAFETKEAIENGAEEIDMVMNIGRFKNQEFSYVVDDIKAVVAAAAQGKVVKVILETCLLTPDEIKKACELCLEAKAHFVKTSTGFNKRGATLEDVRIMKETVQDNAEVKAAGGVRSKADLVAMLAAGATRIGTSSGVKLMLDEEVKTGY